MPGEGDFTPHIPLDPEMTGPEPGEGVTTETTPPAEAGSGSGETPETKTETKGDGAAAETTGDAAKPEEWELEIPGGGKLTAKELADLRAASEKAAAAEATARELEQRQRELDQAAQRQKTEREKQARENLIDPFTQADQWKRTYFNHRLSTLERAGKEVDDQALLDETERAWMDAKINVQAERFQEREKALEEERRQLQIEREGQWLTSTIDRELAIAGREVINNDEGREDVRAHLAAILNARGEITETDIQSTVKKVAARANDYVSKYVNKKKGQAAATGPIGKGGGAQPAPSRKKYGSDLTAFSKIGNDIERGGG